MRHRTRAWVETRSRKERALIRGVIFYFVFLFTFAIIFPLLNGNGFVRSFLIALLTSLLAAVISGGLLYLVDDRRP